MFFMAFQYCVLFRKPFLSPRLSYFVLSCNILASLVVQRVKNPPSLQETQVQSLGWEDPLEKKMASAKSLQSCLTLCDPIDGSPPGSPAPGILQARTLEWVAISFSSA